MAREEKTEDRDYGGVAVVGAGYRALKKKGVCSFELFLISG